MESQKRKINVKPIHILQVGLVLFLFVFLLLPLVFMLFQAKGVHYGSVFIDNGDLLLKSTLNSFLYSTVSTVISVVLATVCAYFLSRARIKGKKWFVILLVLPMLIPTVSIGLGVKLLFTSNGFFQKIFGLKFDGSGLFDLIVGSVVFSFPAAFLLIYDSLLYEDKSIYDAANTLGIKRFRSFFGITLPYLKTTLISAFFASFILIFADYGLPLEVAGKLNTLPHYLYLQFSGTVISKEKGAVISLVLLIPAIIAFVVDILNKETSDGVAKSEKIKPSKAFNGVAIAVISIVGILLILPTIAFVSLSFMKRFPNNTAFTFDHYKKAFSPYTSEPVPRFLKNSLTISLLVGIVGTIVSYVCGYVSTRTKGPLTKVVHLLSISSLAVPGLVLGVGYLFLFDFSSGFFADTIMILIIVNMIHYFSSPYLMAKNAFEKIDKNYETVAETLGISKTSMFFKVMIPNTVGTILQMFSYLFINSMITISAVSILCSTNALKPLAVSITVFDNQANWEMESVVSTLILAINLFMKIGFDILSKYISKIGKRKVEKDMELNRFQFNLLAYIEEHNKQALTQRKIADGVTLSLGTTNKIINQFIEDDLIVIHNDKTVEITEKGYKALEPYKVRKAIVIAAGFGSRMAPVTLDTPKPLVKVNGVRIIDTLLDALIAKGIDNITLVVGYKKEQFNQLLEKYPTLKFIDNPIYNESNNISSVYAAKDIIDRCYICEADLVVANPKVITKYQYCSNYLGAYVTETDDWCFFKKGNYINKVAIGGENCWHMIGISYWDEKDSAKLREDIAKVFHSRGGKEKYWDNVPLTVCKHDFEVEVRDCKKKDVTEIDNFSELVIIDPSYANYKR